jgi:hypothetical protein
VENHRGGDNRQTGKLTWRRGWKIKLAAPPSKLENYHGGRHTNNKTIAVFMALSPLVLAGILWGTFLLYGINEFF